ncbi:MAG: hypothetical protein IPI67_37610 [Myxococcales bacterium]|nr:hypothetical protein [Myxococcales bacterium]
MRAAKLFFAASCTSLAACGFLLGRNGLVTLEKAEVRSMGVDIRRDQKTICPREPVQVAVFADVVLEGEQKLEKLETWRAGSPRQRNLDFAEFTFQSDAGRFDENGWLSPNRNLLATVAREFHIKTVFRRRPDKFTFITNYKPDYDCIKQAGRDGAPGSSGSLGAQGSSGSPGSAGLTTTKTVPATSPGGFSTTRTEQGPGGAGGNGSPGGPGGNGTPGGPGARFAVYLTLVKTPFYDKLVAARIVGDIDDFLLFPPERALLLHANGGPGGSGGPGGQGGAGGPGGSGSPPGAQGQRGTDGPGGSGGRGGPGGSIDIFFDGRFEEELSTAINAQANAGRGGPGGAGGGAMGSPGARGRVTRTPADVHERFAALDGVTVL